MRSKLLVWLIFPVMTVAAMAYTRVSARPSAPGLPGIEIAQPADWAGFDAELEISQPGAPLVVGHFYRASDGSERKETGPQGQAQRVISIHNISQERWYVRSASGQWTSGPMRLPPEGWHPIHWIQNQRITKQQEKMGEFDIYREESASGSSIYLRAPALNMFAILDQNVVNGRRQAFSNIHVGEPAPEMFQPPEGVAVSQSEYLNGIVTTDRDDPSTLKLPVHR